MPRFSRRQVALAALLAASVVLFAISLRGGRPAPRHRRSAAVAVVGTTAGAGAAKAEEKLRPAAPANTDYRRYASLESSSIFAETRNAPIPPPGRGGRLPNPPPFPNSRTPGPSPGPRGPDLAGWSYAGCATLRGEKLGVLKLGIVQNEDASTVSYLAVGDSFMGARVESLDQEAIRFSSGASSTTLSRPRDFPVKPLEGGPGAAGGPQPPPPPPPNPGQPRGR